MTEKITSFQEFSRRRVAREPQQPVHPTHPTHPIQQPHLQRRRRRENLSVSAPVAPPAADAVHIEPPVAEQPGIARLRLSLGREPEHVERMLLMRHVQTTEGPRWIGSLLGTDVIEMAGDAINCLVLLNDSCKARGLAPLYAEDPVEDDVGERSDHP